MSSTGRGYDRHKADYYVTPQKPIKEFLSAFLLNENIERPDNILFLDPCAGGSEKDEMSYPSVIKKEFGANAMTFDIREDSLAKIKQDYLFTNISDPKPGIIITNPPFNIALDVIKKALNDVADDGFVIMLLRLNFMGSKERKPFFDLNMPKSIYVHSKRMNFIPDWLNENIKASTGKYATGDSIEYAHFVWQKSWNEFQNERYPRTNYSMLYLI